MILKPIRLIHSPFKEPAGTPIQPVYAEGMPDTVEISKEFAEGLRNPEVIV